MNDFKIERKEGGGVQILHLHGYLDAHTAPHLEQELQNLLKEQKYKIVINFKELNYISSAGLGVFMAFIEDVREQKGDIKLSNMSPKVFNVFDLLGFPMIYEIFSDETEAITKFKGASAR